MLGARQAFRSSGLCFNPAMTPKERLIEQFRALCMTHGVDSIAKKIGANAENLRQIQRGLKLKSGEPRGVGPKIQRALDAHYPGWASAAVESPSEPAWPLGHLITPARLARLHPDMLGAWRYEAHKLLAKFEQEQSGAPPGVSGKPTGTDG